MLSARSPFLLLPLPTMLRGMALCLLMISLKIATTMASDDPLIESSTTTLRDGEEKCWIFTHLQKCGGSTVKRILTQSFGPQFTTYDSLQWKRGDEPTRKFQERLSGGAAWHVVAGGYTEALRRSADITATTAGATTCDFFTLFRHPISRMVSAYFYCRVYATDVACASEIVRARDADLLTFAKHWSNFGLRQFALDFVPADDVMAYMQTPEAMALLPESIEDLKQVSGWYLLKLFLERPEAQASGVGSEQMGITTTTDQQAAQQEEQQVPDAQLYEFLEPVQNLIREGFAAVGIIEEWNTTLALFDNALDMPGVDWRKQYAEEGSINVFGRNQQLKAETLEKAWTDAELKKYMRLDLLLYEHAVDVFHEQVHSYGLP
ncbi:unnamed protein product [Pylaiella littoralis]